MQNSTVIVCAIIVLSFLPGCGRDLNRDSAPQPKPAVSENAARVLQGKLVKIEGESYVVQNSGGEEVRVHVGKDTALDGRIKVGDKVDAQISADGHATTILKALE